MRYYKLKQWVKDRWPLMKKKTHRFIVLQAEQAVITKQAVITRKQQEIAEKERAWSKLAEEWYHVTVRLRSEPGRFVLRTEFVLDDRFVRGMPDLAYAMNYASHKITADIERKIREIDFARFQPGETYGTYKQRL